VSWSCGIVGLPNVGKTLLYNLVCRATAAVANYPFCTIDPHVGVVAVPDARLEFLGRLYRPQQLTPATLEVVDIAGLVKGAAAGEGLGNQFLAHIRAVDLLWHVVRCFEDPNIVHVYGSVDPLRDVEIVELELVLKDLEFVERQLQGLEKRLRAGASEEQHRQAALLGALREWLQQGNPVQSFPLSAEQAEWVRQWQLLTGKPVIYVANAAVGNARSAQWVEQLREMAQHRGNSVVALDIAWEAELQELPEQEREQFLRELGLEHSGVETLLQESLRRLRLVTFYTVVGGREVRAWLVPEGTTAVEAAGRVHSDFARGFVRVEVMSVAELQHYGSEEALRSAGRYRIEGRSYQVADGDILYFRSIL
jgi:GTP-binding protein YchF